MSRRAPIPAAALTVLLAIGALTAACTEGTLTGPLEGGIEEPAESKEVFIRADAFPLWQDTTFVGYAIPTDASFFLVADGPDFRARSLLRYEDISDSVVVDSVPYEVESYQEAEIVFTVDTAMSRIPSGGVVLRLMELSRPYDHEEVDWRNASAGMPWSSPGGDLAHELARVDLTGVPDTVFPDTVTFELGGATDSLLSTWSRQGGDPGLALLAEGPGARLRLGEGDLDYEVRPAGLDTVVSRLQAPFPAFSPITFIYDPPFPASGRSLRVGGLPAHRSYFVVVPPDTVDGVPVTEMTINRAEFVFVPRADIPQPFAATDSPNVSLVELIRDPFELGPKTPVGGGVSSQRLMPDSLAAGQPLKFEVTSLISRWAESPDSVGPFLLGVRYQPDSQTLGYWEFGSVESEAALRPYLRLVVTLPSGFEIP